MSTRDLEEVLGALRSAAAKEQMADLLTTLLTREEVSEMAERLHAVRTVLGERARVFVPKPERRFTYLLPSQPRVAVLRDAPQKTYGGGRYGGERATKERANQKTA